MSKLVIVESPTKTKTLKKILGSDYTISATLGHIRDLPRKKFGVDLETFEPDYVAIPNKKKIIKELQKEADKSDEVILAVDLDREGEAIAWHTAQILGLGDNYKRIVFSEITKPAIEKALSEPRSLDSNLIEAQQARRILDRIVGYKLSPLLWKKIARGLSAGRVQSVALRIIVEREKEIDAFKPQEYWSIKGLFDSFEAELRSIDGERLDKFFIENKKQAQEIKSKIEGIDQFQIAKVEKKEKKRSPYPPFTTATLQQDAWYKLHSSSKQTAYLAQRLYEKGLITYHRTDSLNIAKEAIDLAGKIIKEDYGNEYYDKPQVFKTKSKSAQEAHEAIRPSYPDKRPGEVDLDKKQAALYNLIWSRFISSQMKPAIFDNTKIHVEGGKYLFRAKGRTLKFDGFTKVYPVKHKDSILPPLEEEQIVSLNKVESEQHFTRPPARYSDASLIKKLKKEGIGRPSTYAPIVSVIQDRGYAGKNKDKRFYPTDLGIMVSDLLVENFPRIFDLGFTAQMEDNLDQIAEGKAESKKVLEEFYKPFAKNLEEGYDKIKKKVEKTDKKCPECKEPLLIRMGRYGKFYGCSAYPECKYTKNIVDKIGMDCPECEGQVIRKRTKKGKVFYGCSNYPECEYASWDDPRNEVE